MPVDIFTREEFERAIEETRPTPLGLVDGEFAYLIRVTSRISIHLRSSVGRAGVSADCGEDSIRAWLVENGSMKPWGSKVGRWTTRVPGWHDRLMEVLSALYLMGRKIRPCPDCEKGLMKVFIVKKPGPTKGHLFLSCPTSNGGCGHFEWLED